MNIYIAVDLFALIVLIYCIILDFFTMILRLTGLPDEKARFQVMSLLTGCGFTTHESEMILTLRPRRRMALTIMLFGYVFNITIVSAFINVFLSLKQTQVEKLFLGALAPSAVVILFFILLRVPKVRELETRLFQRLAGRILGQPSANTVMLLDHIGSDSIAQILLREVPEDLRDKPLADTGLKNDRNILVMLVERGGRKAEAPDGFTVFQNGDKLTVFGNIKTICSAFQAREQFVDEE